MADNLNYFSDDEESAWLPNTDPSLLDALNEGKQLEDSNTTEKMKTDLNVWTR